MEDVLQIVGALLVLAGFAAIQFGWTKADTYPYLLMNLVGSAILAVLAAIEVQWGFLLLEGVWAIVSAWGLLAKATGRAVASPGH